MSLFEIVAELDAVTLDAAGHQLELIPRPGQLAVALDDDTTAAAPPARRSSSRSTRTTTPADAPRLIAGPGITSPAPMPGQQDLTRVLDALELIDPTHHQEQNR